jgi:hypothetical protein
VRLANARTGRETAPGSAFFFVSGYLAILSESVARVEEPRDTVSVNRHGQVSQLGVFWVL